MLKGKYFKKVNNIQLSSIDPSTVLVINSIPNDQIFRRKRTSRSCYEIILFSMFVICLLFALFYIVINPLIHRISTLYSDKDIIKSRTDTNIYSIIKLNNGIEAILISESTLKLSAVSLSIGVGGATNDNNSIGIAHLSHHLMLEKSQESNRSIFSNRLGKNFGFYYSSFTDDTTSFFYEIGNDAFKDSFKEFAQMIHSPIITKEILSNAIDVIEAEFRSNQKVTTTLENHIINQVSLKDYSYFPNGNSLNYNKSSDDLIELVKQFNSKYYTGSNMKLVVMSYLSIENIKGLVIKHFQHFNKTSYDESSKKIITKQDMSLGKLIKYTLSYGSYVNFAFFIDSSNQPIYSDCYLKYIQYMLRDKKEGSLSYYLRKESYITSLSSTYFPINKSLIKFTINLQLTQGGEVNLYLVFKLIFNYLKLIRDNKTIYEIYADIQRINNLNFDYNTYPKEYHKFANDISLNMFKFEDDLKMALLGKYYMRDYNDTSIKYYLNQFKVENCLILYASKFNFTSEIIRKLVKQGRYFDSQWTKEKWYQSFYVYGDFTTTVIKELDTQIKYSNLFSLRERNPYISQTNYIFKEEDDYNNFPPIKLFNISHIKVWYKPDRSFHIPKVNAFLYIITPLTRQADLKDYPISLMIFQYIKLSIEENLEDIKASGNSIEVKESENGLLIEIDCYSDLIELIMGKLSNICFNPIIDDKKLNLIIKLVFNYLSIKSEKKGYQNAYEYFKIIMKQQMPNYFNIVSLGGNLSKEKNKIKNMLKGIALTCLFYGDINKTTVETIYHSYLLPNIKVDSTLLETNLRVFSEDQVMNLLYSHHQRKGSFIFRIEKVFSNDSENLTSNFFQVEEYSEELDIILTLMTILWGKKFTTFIRTNLRKTHYAFINKLLLDNVFYFNFVVQGNDDPSKANLIMDKSIEQILKSLLKITDDELYYAKENLINHKMKKDKSLQERAEKVFREIRFNSLNFNQTIINRKIMISYTKERIINQFKKIFYTDVMKVSIQRYYNGTIAKANEMYYLNQSIPSIITNDPQFFNNDYN